MNTQQTTQIIEAIKTWNINVESESGRQSMELLATKAQETAELYIWLGFVSEAVSAISFALVIGFIAYALSRLMKDVK